MILLASIIGYIFFGSGLLPRVIIYSLLFIGLIQTITYFQAIKDFIINIDQPQLHNTFNKSVYNSYQ